MQESRPSLFQILKPHCVALSEVALEAQRTGSSPNLLLTRLENLLTVLRSASDKRLEELSAKIAEYVFFPLSHVFRQAQTASVKILQLSLQCLSILLKFGWRDQIAPELAFQLIILLSLLAESRSEAEKRRDDTEDLQQEAFTCLCLVLKSLLASNSGRKALVDIDSVPALGRMISVVLEGISQTKHTSVSLAALRTLRTFTDGIGDRDVLASFLPGITSCLTQVLTPSTQTRRPYKILQEALRILTRLLKDVLADEHQFLEAKKTATPPSSTIAVLDKTWLAGTAPQIKMALANIVKLRGHARTQVRKSLQELCKTVLETMQENLSGCLPMMADTYIALSHDDSNEQARFELLRLSRQSSVVADCIRSGLYDRFASFPRLLLSNDDTAKAKTMNYIKTSYQLLSEADVSLVALHPLIFSSLLEGLTSLVEEPVQALLQDPQLLAIQHTGMQLEISGKTKAVTFPEILNVGQHNNDNASLLAAVVKEMSSGDGALDMVREALTQSRGEASSSRLASYWLSLNILRNRHQAQADYNDLLQLPSTTSSELDLHEDLFHESLSALIRSTDPATTDYRLLALSLEGLAFYASTLGQSFRPDLADALYPVLHLLGSPNATLRQHAMLALDSIAASCTYDSAQDLIMANVDYMVNGVSMKLNMFDLEPEAPQVLLLLVKLCGPPLLPYLDDVTDNLFDALEHFHGYPSLVRLLFSVLKVMVEEGVKSPALTIKAADNKGETRHLVSPTEPMTMQDVVKQISQARKGHDEQADPPETAPSKAPQRPWQELHPEASSDSSSSSPLSDAVEPNPPTADDTDKPPPHSSTYTLLLRITKLTQHHLPSSSPHIRSLLLTLLTTSLPYLAAHEDTFLPLIHTLWPVLVPRLADREAYVVSGVLDVMGAMCVGGGDFMRGRVADVWDDVRRIHRMVSREQGHDEGKKRLKEGTSISGTAATRTPRLLTTNEDIAHITTPLSASQSLQANATSTSDSAALIPISCTSLSNSHASKQDSSAQYTPTTTLILRQALTNFLLTLLRHVNISAWIFDEILTEMLYGALVEEKRADVREALEGVNKDAVWLVLQRDRARRSVAAGDGARWLGERPAMVEGGVAFV